MKNVFDGPDALKDFLNPGKHPNLPMVELPAEFNAFAGDKVRIFAKLMGMSPLGNVKAIPAFNMIREMHRRGDLEGVDRLIENSSGNTVFSMALAARQYGVDRTQAYVPSDISWNKLLMLLFFGIEPIVNIEPQKPSENDPRSGVFKAKVDGRASDAINPGQYDNLDNLRSHQKWTGPQIWEQTNGNINIFCAGLGTTGTLIGNSIYLKSKNPNIRVVGAVCAPDQHVPGVRTENLLKLIGFDWRDHVDFTEPVQTAESYRLSMALSRKGIVVGPSSGLALAGLLQHLDGMKQSGSLGDFRDPETGEVICVFPCPDGPLPYLDEYPKHVDPSHFPPIQNENVLKNKP